MPPPPITAKTAIIGGLVRQGEIVEVPGLEVHVSRRYWWDPERTRAARWRTHKPRAVLWHWTGGEGDGRQIHRTLESRETRGAPDGLSVNFTVSRGDIRQHADIAARTLHGGWANDWTVGVECQNRGRAPALRRWPREVYQDTIHGHEMDLLRFYPEDVAAILRLFDALSGLLELPKIFPTDATGRCAGTRIPDHVLDGFEGHLCHLHVSERKIDPGRLLADQLMARASLAAPGPRP